jgi:hypothetical protein
MKRLQLKAIKTLIMGLLLFLSIMTGSYDVNAEGTIQDLSKGLAISYDMAPC